MLSDNGRLRVEEAAHHDPAARKRVPTPTLNQGYPASEKGGSGRQAQSNQQQKPERQRVQDEILFGHQDPQLSQGGMPEPTLSLPSDTHW